jgi:ABC-type spermidine/putrescine transport system permease subunit II
MTNTSDYKQRTTERTTRAFVCASKIAFVVIIVYFFLALIAVFWFKDAEKVLAAKLIYSALGMLIGVLEIVLGILLALIGVTVDYDIDASAGFAKVKLASTSPGLLLIVCGNLLMGFSLMRGIEYRKIDYQESQPPAPGASPLSSPHVPPMPAGGPK